MRKIKCPHCGAENDTGSKTCDDCGRYMQGAKESVKYDPHRGRCSWESDGMRCANAGTVTDSTSGSDSWYCTAHAGCKDPSLGHDIVLHSLRMNPSPDFSIESRRARSLRVAENAVPEMMRGWTVDEYRQYARTMIKGLIKRTTEVAK